MSERCNTGRLAIFFAAMLFLAVLAPASLLAQANSSGYQPAEWAKVVAAARKEGKVTFYSAVPPAGTQALVASFKAAYPDIEVEVLRLVSGEALAKLSQERAGKLDGADLWLGTEIGWFMDRAKEGALLKIAGPSSVNWPGRYLREGTVVIGGVEPFIIVYNTKLVANPPKSYADLLRPDLKGRIGASALAATVSVAFYDWLQKTEGEDFLSRLKSQNPRIYASAVASAQGVTSGEIAVSSHGIPTATRPLMQLGGPVDYVVPNPAFGIEFAIGALGWAKRPNAALVLADHLMSANAQTAWHGGGGSASPLPGIKGSLDAATVNGYNASAYPAEVVRTYTERWTKIFK